MPRNSNRGSRLPESELTSIIFNGLSLTAWANFPPHGLDNPLFLAEKAKFIKNLWSAGWHGGSLSARISIGLREKKSAVLYANAAVRQKMGPI
jgi:hypothetical protein